MTTTKNTVKRPARAAGDIRISRHAGDPDEVLRIAPEDGSWELVVDERGMPSLAIGIEVPEDELCETVEEAEALEAQMRAEGRLDDPPAGPMVMGYMPADLFYAAAPELRPRRERVALEEARALALPEDAEEGA